MKLVDPEVIAAIASSNRRRQAFQKMRIGQTNMLHSTIASTEFGYRAGMPEAEREAAYSRAVEHCALVARGEAESRFAALIAEQTSAIAATLKVERDEERAMEGLARQLPVAAWVEHPDQAGFGFGSLAKIVGTAGDLCNFPNPGKLLKFFSLLPYTSNGVTRLGSAWRRFGGLSALEWTEFGYSPRRRSMMYVISTCMVKLGSARPEKVLKSGKVTPARGVSPYRAYLDESREQFKARHPDATKMRTLRHAQTKMACRLLVNLWAEWVRQAGATREELRERWELVMAGRARPGKLAA